MISPIARQRSESERQQLIADLFHALNQPMTALRCALELELLREGRDEAQRETMQTALAKAEEIARLTGGLRELLQAEDPGDERSVQDLASLVRETMESFSPVAEGANIELVLQCNSPCPVCAELERLRQALFYLTDWVIGATQEGGQMHVATQAKAGKAVLTLAISRCGVPNQESPKLPDQKTEDLWRRLNLAIARGILESAGGCLRTENDGAGLSFQVRFPLARRAR